MSEKGLTAKMYLEQLEQFDITISQDLELLADMKAKAESSGGFDYSKDRVQTSMQGDRLCADVARYVDFETQINAEIERFTAAKNRIIDEIRGLHETKYIQLLFKIYVQFKSLKITADEMQLSYSYVLELHKKALKRFETTYKNLDYLC
jgi:hypothetical protein